MTQFSDFNSRAGFSALSEEIIEELAELAKRRGIQFSTNGGSLGSTEMTIKLVAQTADTKAVEAEEKRNWARACRYVCDPITGNALEPEDYGVVVGGSSDRFKMTEIHLNRPKYPFSGVCQRTGKTYKLSRGYISKIIAARKPKSALDNLPPLPATPVVTNYEAAF